MTFPEVEERGGDPAALSSPLPSVDDARAFVDLLFTDVPSDLYLLLFTKPGNASCFFPVAQRSAAVAEAIRQRSTHDVYIGCGLRSRDLGRDRRGGNDDVAGIVGLWADLDIDKPGASKVYFPSLDAAMTFVSTLPVLPTVVVTTGGGIHVWWLFKEPWCFADAEDREHAARLVEGWQRLVIARAKPMGVAVDTTFDLARILRVPGTINHKHGVAVTLLKTDGPRIDPGDIEPFLPVVAPSTVRASTSQPAAFILRSDDEPPRDKFEALYTNDPRFRDTWDHRRPDLHDQSFSAYDQSLANMAAQVGWNDQEIVDLLIAHRRRHGADLKLRQDYYTRTIARARSMSGRNYFSAYSTFAHPASAATGSSDNVVPVSTVNGDDPDSDDHGALDQGAPPTFPEAAWRGPFTDYRTAMDGTTEAPDCFHFSSLWTAASAHLRRRVSFYYGYTTYPNVYLVNVGVTGDAKKTSGMRHGVDLTAPDRVKVLRGVGSAEALADWMASDEDDDGDIESDAMRTHLLVLEELGSCLIRGGWSGSTLIAFLTETFDTPPVYEIPFRKKPVRVVEPTPVLLAGTTPDWLWKSLRENDIHGGFGNRLFFLAGAGKEPIAMPERPDLVRLDLVRTALEGLDEVSEGDMRLAPDAQELWTQFYLAWRRTRLDTLLAAMTKRLPTYAIKLALIYAAFERTAPTITRDQIAAAILVARFGLASAEWLIAQRRGYSQQGNCEEATLHALARTDLPTWKVHQRIGGRFTAEDTHRAIRALMATGAIVEVGKTRRRESIYGLRGRRRDP